MDNINIPPEALEAGKDNAFNWLRSHMEDDVRVQHMTDEELTELVGAVCLAMLKAWPHRKDEWRDNITFDGKPVRYSVIILPLPQENTNAEV